MRRSNYPVSAGLLELVYNSKSGLYEIREGDIVFDALGTYTILKKILPAIRIWRNVHFRVV